MREISGNPHGGSETTFERFLWDHKVTGPNPVAPIDVSGVDAELTEDKPVCSASGAGISDSKPDSIKYVGDHGPFADPRPCPVCGRPFAPATRYLKRGRGLYCSLKCAGAAPRIVPPFNTPPSTKAERVRANGLVNHPLAREAVRITLPWPPSANRYWRKTRWGRVYTSPEARAYRWQAAMKALAQGVRPVKGMVIVELDLYRPANRGDTDNFVKVILDALNGVAWADDKQVKRIEAEKFIDRKNPRVELRIRESKGGGAEKPRCVVCVTPNVERRRS